ncbi:bifunctional folylpolyglutamate synthase/dihydrofolate synthase [Peptostreptococcus faecalis]|uniref:bifunctional folylpolyglutamate synthase/dihydrofolate synthase n=1 Tax=Peptostreptococcus faecalis TaxID=2045015 RepID=UPI000C7CC95B|nr:folylpolyglutamate synthase/dihydrofolate synthase family protein [Peptostreptococcus faecalis]
MDYKESLEYIHGIGRFGMVLGLDIMKELLKRLENPEKNYKIVHVAGTNGKGSTSSYIYNTLVKSGYKTGLYTSPYLEKFNERIKIDSRDITDEEVAECATYVRNTIEEMLKDGFRQPTEFEVVTAVALLFYKRIGAEVVVLEVGLGGRYDATNAVESTTVSVIASIGLDHIGVLGDTVEMIAYEKAGIIKNNGNVFLYEQSESVTDIIKEVCDSNHAKLRVSKNLEAIIKKSNINNQVFDFVDYSGELFEDVKIRMIGKHQVFNASLAIDVLVYLKESGELEKISKEAIYDGLLDARWAGRFEVISEKPLFIIDGAHNLDAAKFLATEVNRLIPSEYKKILILGLLKDKDVDGIIKTLVPSFDKVVVTLPDNPRAMAVEEVAYRVGMYCDDIVCIEDVEDSLKYVEEIFNQTSKEKVEKNQKNKKQKGKKIKNYDNKKEKYMVVSAGSLYLVGNVRKSVKEKFNK